MKGGKNSGEDSFVPSLPTSHRHFEDVPEEIHAPLPDASLAGPSYFSNFQHRFYDPLSLKVPEGESESPSAYRHRGLLAGIVENEAQAPAPALAPAMPPSVPLPLSAPTSPSSAQALPAPALSSVPNLAEDWSSGSGEGEEDVPQAPAPAPAPLEPAPAPSPPAQVLPAPALSLVPILANEWSSGSDEGEENEAQAPAPAVQLETAPALLSVPILADDWSSGSDEEGSSGSDEEGEGGLAEEWSSASGESEAIPAVDDVVENWSSASHGSGSGSSNTPLTLNARSDPPLMLEMLPLYSDDFRALARSYGPQDFGHLADEIPCR